MNPPGRKVVFPFKTVSKVDLKVADQREQWMLVRDDRGGMRIIPSKVRGVTLP